MATQPNPSDIDLGPTASRMNALSDGVYAIAMTLLVLNIEIPHIPAGQISSQISIQLLNQFPTFFHYFLSFILLGSFWMINHIQFHYIKRVNRALLWINIFNLMFVALIPFSTSVISDYGNNEVAAIFFHSNLFMIGLMFYCNWWYATRSHNLVDHNLSNKRILAGRRRSLVTPAIALIAIIISFITPRWSTAPYALIPFLIIAQNKH